jgi:hypothetical protein
MVIFRNGVKKKGKLWIPPLMNRRNTEDSISSLMVELCQKYSYL